MNRKTDYSRSTNQEARVLSIQQTERFLVPFPCPPLFEKPPFVLYERILPAGWPLKKRNREPSIKRTWQRFAGFFRSMRRHSVSPSGLGHEQAY